MSVRGSFAGIALAAMFAAALGMAAAWPIYQNWWLTLPTVVGLTLGLGIIAYPTFSPRRRVGQPMVLRSTVALAAAFVVTVLPVAVPQSLSRAPWGLLAGVRDGVAATVLGWKQLLTLTLPVGSYQAMLVPAYLVMLISVAAAALIAVHGGRFAPLAAVPLIFPTVFGTVFGAAAVSGMLEFGWLRIAAPRELALWGGIMAVAAGWVWFSAGAEKRQALRRGRLTEERSRAGLTFRVLGGAATVLLALLAGIVCAPAFESGARQVPRDRIDPEVVLRARASPLAAYRGWKRDDTLDTPLFSVAADVDAAADTDRNTAQALPLRLRLSVLDAYNGVDFHVGTTQAGRFTRFPSAGKVPQPVPVQLTVARGYSDIWVPTAALGSVPKFSGVRAAELADAFYLNRDTGAALAMPGGAHTEGLSDGDSFAAVMDASPDAVLSGGPATDQPQVDVQTMPELAAWLRAQAQPATAEGLVELITRLRERGYLSHSLGNGEGERLWLERLAATHGTRFESAAGGHSIARIEHLFSQLNTQQRLAGEGAPAEQLVAGVGDDEQFAAAAALLARALGFDSRVVLGVRLGGEDRGVPGIAACAGECTGEHLAAWVEVRGAEGVWVPMDVTPQLESPPSLWETGERLPEFATTPEERDAREVDPPLGASEHSEQTHQTDQRAAHSWLLPVLQQIGLGVAALILLLLPLLFLPLAKRWRQKRRRAEPDPELRALGAWQELVDDARDSGIVLPQHAGRAQVAEVIGTNAAALAAAAADRAVFSAPGISVQEAELMWAAVQADRSERAAALTGWQRLRARYTLASYGVRWDRRRQQPPQ